MADAAPPAARWHNTLPAWLAVVSGLILQTVTVSMYLGQVRGDLDSVMATNVAQEIRLKDVEAETQRAAVGVATLIAQVQALRDSLGEVKATQRETQQITRRIAEKIGAEE